MIATLKRREFITLLGDASDGFGPTRIHWNKL